MFTSPDHSEVGRDGRADVIFAASCSPITLSILFTRSTMAIRIFASHESGSRSFTASDAVDFSGTSVPKAFAAAAPTAQRLCDKYVTITGVARVLKYGKGKRRRSNESASSKVSRRPAANSPLVPDERGAGGRGHRSRSHLRKASRWSCYAQLPPRSLAPSDVINFCGGVGLLQTCRMKSSREQAAGLRDTKTKP
jgi:hypothetical protein